MALHVAGQRAPAAARAGPRRRRRARLALGVVLAVSLSRGAGERIGNLLGHAALIVDRTQRMARLETRRVVKTSCDDEPYVRKGFGKWPRSRNAFSFFQPAAGADFLAFVGINDA